MKTDDNDPIVLTTFTGEEHSFYSNSNMPGLCHSNSQIQLLLEIMLFYEKLLYWCHPTSKKSLLHPLCYFNTQFMPLTTVVFSHDFFSWCHCHILINQPVKYYFSRQSSSWITARQSQCLRSKTLSKGMLHLCLLISLFPQKKPVIFIQLKS